MKIHDILNGFAQYALDIVPHDKMVDIIKKVIPSTYVQSIVTYGMSGTKIIRIHNNDTRKIILDIDINKSNRPSDDIIIKEGQYNEPYNVIVNVNKADLLYINSNGKIFKLSEYYKDDDIKLQYDIMLGTTQIQDSYEVFSGYSTPGLDFISSLRYDSQYLDTLAKAGRILSCM